MPDLASVHGTAAGRAPVLVVQEASRRSKKRRVSTEGGGDKDVKAAADKIEYECRFCFMKFEKSQALGGHMNRHRQEREKEQYEHAQQIVSSVAQEQMPRTWSSLSAEMIESPSGPGDSSSHLGSHLSGGTTRQQFVAPPISFGTSYRSSSPTNCNLGTQLPPSPRSTCNYYLPSNVSSCNISNLQNQQLQQLMGSIDGFSNATSNSPRSVTFHHHPMENSMAVSMIQPEFLASMFRNSGTPIDSSPLHVSPDTPTSLQAPGTGTYDVIYNSQFLNGGM